MPFRSFRSPARLSLLALSFFSLFSFAACAVDTSDPAPQGLGRREPTPGGETPGQTGNADEDPGSAAEPGTGTEPGTNTPPTGPGTVIEGNPFVGADLFVSPRIVGLIETSKAKSPQLAAKMAKVQSISTAIWLDKIATLPSVKTNLDAALALQKKNAKPMVTSFVVYDLPNRDCAANSSNGELQLAADGEAKYKRDYIDVIAAEFAAHKDQRVVVFLEPDSLGNLVTNTGVAKCAVAADAYKRLTAYAISKLALPNVAIYMDLGHSGWLGWPNNRAGAAAVFKEVVTLAGGPSKIRGFATNVSNYTEVKQPTPDPRADAFFDFNPIRDEASFVAAMADEFTKVGLGGKAFVIDTSRNGQSAVRTKWGNWCNIKGAGLGARPTVAPMNNVDAYYWVKTPGESDGVASPTAPRFDPMCQSADSFPGAPQAGEWFHEGFVSLVEKANPAL